MEITEVAPPANSKEITVVKIESSEFKESVEKDSAIGLWLLTIHFLIGISRDIRRSTILTTGFSALTIKPGKYKLVTKNSPKYNLPEFEAVA